MKYPSMLHYPRFKLWIVVLAGACFCRTTIATTVWIDTDPSIGSPLREVDDAYALVLAFHSPEIWIAGISTSYGNADLKRTTAVARELVDRFGARSGLSSGNVHVGASSAQDGETAATTAFASTLRRRSRITYVALGPLTNLATFVRLHPNLVERIERVIFVGGTSPGVRIGFGRTGFQISDANVVKDPEAVRTVLRSKIPVLLAPAEVSSHFYLNTADLQLLREGGPAGRYLSRHSGVWLWFWTHHLQTRGGPLFDTLAILPGANRTSVRIETRYAIFEQGLVAQRSSTPGSRKVEFIAGFAPQAKRMVVDRLRRDRK